MIKSATALPGAHMRPVSWVLVLLVTASMPLAAAGSSQSTPASAVCVMSNTDSCTTSWTTGPAAQYVLSIDGSFTGTVTLVASSHADPAVAYTIECSGTIAGPLTMGTCDQRGTFPMGLIDLSCVSKGMGAATCAVAGA